MQVDDQILALAQREKRACSSIVYSLETLAWPQLHSHAQDFSMVGTISLKEDSVFFFLNLTISFLKEQVELLVHCDKENRCKVLVIFSPGFH